MASGIELFAAGCLVAAVATSWWLVLARVWRWVASRAAEPTSARLGSLWRALAWAPLAASLAVHALAAAVARATGRLPSGSEFDFWAAPGMRDIPPHPAGAPWAWLRFPVAALVWCALAVAFGAPLVPAFARGGGRPLGRLHHVVLWAGIAWLACSLCSSEVFQVTLQWLGG